MRRINMLLCGLLVCALILPISLAEEGTEEHTPAPATQAPTVEAAVTPASEITNETTSAPAADPSAIATPEASAEPTTQPNDTPAPSPTEETTEDTTEAPTLEPTIESTTEPSTEPSLAPTAEPGTDSTEEPAVEPSEEATVKPSIEPTEAPTEAPTEEPTVEPSATPLPQPGESSGLIAITAEGDVQEMDGIWRFNLSAPNGALAFSWSCAAEAGSYLIYTADSAGSLRFIAETQSAHIELSAADYNNGRFTLHVGAILTDGSTIWGSTNFEIASGFPGGMGGFGGGRPGGGKHSGAGASGAMGEMGEMDLGFRVTPGEALTSSHASGSKDATPYLYSQISDSETAVQSLTLDSTQTQITLDDGASAFLFENAEGTLYLTPEAEGAEWQLSMLAMNTLANSGVAQVAFQLGDHCDTLSTRMELSGSIYANLRAQGYVNKDFQLCISGEGVSVRIAGKQYSINESGELTPLGA